jgi:nitrite reductase/ring-hydroxylating ferredoxin subunit
MKKFIVLLLTFPIVLSCSDSNFNNNNPYLPNYSFAVDININFYDNLRYSGNAIYTAEAGIRGLIIFNTGSGYIAFDAACPNQSLSSCSTMTLKGINAVCSCDNAEYSLFSGQCIGTNCDGKQYPMKQYRVEVSGSTIRVYN